MTTFSRAWSGRPKRQLRLLACWLALALTLAFLPEQLERRLKDHARLLLAPGQSVARAALASWRRSWRAWNYRSDSAAELAQLREQVRRLDEQNLALRLVASGSDFDRSAEVEQPPALIETRAIEARVLGEQPRTLLERLAIVTAKESTELSVGSLALEGGSVLIDQGDNASLTASQLALLGGRVWGKVVEVGPQTAVVRRLNAAGYRSLVRIVHEVDGLPRPLAQGVLEGTGAADCRIRMVDATAPISTGDLVVSAEEPDTHTSMLVYGRIARAELEPGAAHWQIWMTPAVDDRSPATLTVLQPAVNGERLAQREPE
ncbi:MAG TPA: rod shape-determining protein MreC [Pirellulales bacterium]|nr:rod shape-determining protein MreC [Pirellulales bacterium]